MTTALRFSTPHIAAAHRAERFRLLHITTIPMSLVFLRGQVAFMQERGLEIEVASSPGPELEAFGAEHGIRVTAVPMQRRISPRADMQALAQLRRLIRRFRPHILHAHTPKAGLLGTLAGALERVPFRIYHMRGLPLMGHMGARRQLLRITERLSCAAAHRVLCVSRSLRDVAIAERLCDPAKLRVLVGGSGNGVDAAGRFDRSLLPLGTRAVKRAGLRVPEHATVIGFIGRIVRDKGIVELANAWQRLRDEHADAYLLLVGPPETEDPVPAAVLDQLRNDPRVRLVGEDWNTPPLYSAMDLVVLPTYREGFPNVPLEAEGGNPG